MRLVGAAFAGILVGFLLGGLAAGVSDALRVVTVGSGQLAGLQFMLDIVFSWGGAIWGAIFNVRQSRKRAARRADHVIAEMRARYVSGLSSH